MNFGEHEIYSYSTYIKNNNINTRRKNPQIVLDKYGFIPMLRHFELDEGEKPLEIVKEYAKSRQKPSIIIYYRKNDLWGIPTVEVFIKAKD